MRTGSIAALFAIFALAGSASAQDPARIEVNHTSAQMRVGDEIQLVAQVFDANGHELDIPVMFLAGRGQRNRIDVNRRTGAVRAVKGGQFQILALVPTARDIAAQVDIEVAYPPVDRVEVTPGEGGGFYVGASTRHTAQVIDEADDVRDIEIQWTTSDDRIATVDRFGIMTAMAPGSVVLRAEADGTATEVRYDVKESPAVALSVSTSQETARTGDVIRFSTQANDAEGQPVSDMPVTYTVISDPATSATADIAPAEVDDKGRFVAYAPGVYSLVANVPGLSARATVEIHPRHASQEVKFVGQGAVRNVSTSDLWVWEGVDGRDYAITGTHRGHGAVYFWDVTNPASPMLTDSLVVDARVTNDVKVSEDGRIAVFSREGASSRRNGIVIVDVEDPRNVEIITTYDDELTGGVHNLFIYDQHVYAVNNGIRFDVISIEDPANPHRVGRFELDTPGHAIHDIWIVDGIAYTSNWGDGVVVIDVGGGNKGGSPSNPVEISRFADIGGATHAAFPYQSPTGRFYIFMGDEIGAPVFDGQEVGRTPEFMQGFIHIVDFTDPENPEEVARYEVPEAGSHNMWLEDDKMYVAFYQGGLRVVDISGELKGNLYHQGREIAVYKAYDADGVVANAPFTWGPQPYKGNLFFAEYFSGLWAIQLQPQQTLIP